MEEHLDQEELEQRRRQRRRSKIRLAIAVAIALTATGAWAYVRYGVPKSPLGGRCRWAMHCGPDAPACMRPNVDEDGVCSRKCDPKTDCAPGIRCTEIDVDERDERGMPIKSGYCFPQTFLDAQKQAQRAAHAAASSSAR